MARSRKYRRKTKRKGGTKRRRGGGILKYGSNTGKSKKVSFNSNPKNDIQNQNTLQLPNNYEIPYPFTIKQQLVNKFAAKRQNNPTKYWTNGQWCLYFTNLLRRQKKEGFKLNKLDNDIYTKIITSKTFKDEYPCAKRIYTIMDNIKIEEIEKMTKIL